MLKGKVAIVTGGSRGIGLEIVRTYLENGAKVVLFGKEKEGVINAVRTLKEENSSYDVCGYNPNLVDEEEITKILKEVYEKYGRIDILVNNAGISSSTPLLKYTVEEFDRIMDVNVKSVFVMSKVAVPYLIESKGVILNTSSMVSMYGQASGVGYPASKFAVNGITKSLALELAQYGIRVNAVAPGITETEMVKSLPKEMIDPLIAKIPLGRIGTPKDMANTFLFLASDNASYITGAIINVDGCAKN